MAIKNEGTRIPAKPVKEAKLQTQLPISEKDEVKKAEERLNKHTIPGAAADLKNRAGK